MQKKKITQASLQSSDPYAHVRHTLKGPLTRIHLYAEGLLSGMAGKVTKEQREYLEEIHRSAKMMVEVINDELGGPHTTNT